MSTYARAPRGVALAALALLLTLTFAPAAGAAPRGLAESPGWWAALWSWLAPAGLGGWVKVGPDYDPNGHRWVAPGDPLRQGEAGGGRQGHTKAGPDYDPDGHRLAWPSSPLGRGEAGERHGHTKAGPEADPNGHSWLPPSSPLAGRLGQAGTGS